MAKSKTTNENVSTIGTTLPAGFDGMSEDELRALYESSLIETEERGRKTESGMEHIKNIATVLKITNQNAVKVDVVATMIKNHKQMIENKIASEEGRDPVKVDPKPISQAINHFLNNSKLAKQYFTVTDGRPKLVSLKPDVIINI